MAYDVLQLRVARMSCWEWLLKKRGVGGPEVNVTMKIVWMRHLKPNTACDTPR